MDDETFQVRELPEEMLAIFRDRNVSPWLRDAVIHNACRDPVDARRDVFRLLRALDAWLDLSIDRAITDDNAIELTILEDAKDVRF